MRLLRAGQSTQAFSLLQVALLFVLTVAGLLWANAALHMQSPLATKAISRKSPESISSHFSIWAPNIWSQDTINFCS